MLLRSFWWGQFWCRNCPERFVSSSLWCLLQEYVIYYLKLMYWKSKILIVAIDEQEGIHRGCGWFQTLKDDTNPVLKRDRCTEAKIAYDGPSKGNKVTVCLCSEDLCNTSTKCSVEWSWSSLWCFFFSCWNINQTIFFFFLIFLIDLWFFFH